MELKEIIARAMLTLITTEDGSLVEELAWLNCIETAGCNEYIMEKIPTFNEYLENGKIKEKLPELMRELREFVLKLSKEKPHNCVIAFKVAEAIKALNIIEQAKEVNPAVKFFLTVDIYKLDINDGIKAASLLDKGVSVK